MSIEPALIDEICVRYPSLSRSSVDWHGLAADERIDLLVVEAGARVFDAGNPCAGFPLVLDGVIAVTRGSVDGRSLELYRVRPGEICVVSTAGLLSSRPPVADGTALERTKLAVLSPALFERWNSHPAFRQFVMGVFADRLGDLMAVVDAVAFQRLDRRLANYLLGRGRHLEMTHQAIAEELGTVREMITRLLDRFEDCGAVKLSRGHIEIVDAIGLRSIARGDALAEAV